MKKIERLMLVFSRGSGLKGLFGFAAALAGQLHADLIVASILNERDIRTVGCITPMGYEVGVNRYISSNREERKKVFRQLAAEIDFPLERLKIVIKSGHPVSQLLNICREEQADMIITQWSGLGAALTGSLTEELYCRSPVSVLTYRNSR